MATPIENVQRLRAYWRTAINFKLSGNALTQNMEWQRLAQQLWDAQHAMHELVDQAANNTYVRTTVFAGESVFETCLIQEPAASVTKALLTDEAKVGSMAYAIARTDFWRPPRQIMLDGIRKAGDGGFFTAKDPTGVTSWLRSASVAGAATISVLKTDTTADVIAALLGIYRDLALPVEWLQLAMSQRAFETLESRIATTLWASNTISDLAIRQTLKGLTLAALGRAQTDLAKLEVAKVAKLPTDEFAPVGVPTADGQPVATTPPPPKPWYRQGAVLSASALGLLAGGAYAHQRP